MSLALADQYRMAMVQQDFGERVTAAVFSVAVTMLSATANTDPTVQKQRLALAKQVALQADSATPVFTWLCVSRPGVNTVADLTDGFLTTTVSTLFDAVAQNTIPVASLP